MPPRATFDALKVRDSRLPHDLSPREARDAEWILADAHREGLLQGREIEGTTTGERHLCAGQITDG